MQQQTGPNPAKLGLGVGCGVASGILFVGCLIPVLISILLMAGGLFSFGRTVAQVQDAHGRRSGNTLVQPYRR